MQKYYGNYLGIVVHDADPEYRGRVKVFVPHISATFLQGLTSPNTPEPLDKRFGFVGDNASSYLRGETLKALREVLPWAEAAVPITGASASGTYNASTGQSTVSDATGSVRNSASAPAPAPTAPSKMAPITGANLKLTTSQQADLARLQKIYAQNKTTYDNIAAQTGIPSELVASIHYRESGGNFSRTIANGDEGLGGRTFEADAVKVLKDHGGLRQTGVGGMYDYAERFNGLGYRMKGKPSPYVYAGTDKYVSGKYTQLPGGVDTHYLDPNVVDKQVGVAPMLAALGVSEGGTTTPPTAPPTQDDAPSIPAVDAPPTNTVAQEQLPSSPAAANAPGSPNVATDAFINNEANQVNVNPMPTYATPVYPNAAKGQFSIPTVGSHLWVFFADGDPQFPVYFAAAYGPSDWQGVYNVGSAAPDYPGSYSVSKSEQDPTYRSKWLLNQKGGSIEVVSTDNREMVNITHHNGSYKQFNNFSNVEYAANNDQKLVSGDKFLTIKGSNNQYIQGIMDQIIMGDHIRKVGKLDKDAHQAYKDLAKDFHETKRRFDVMRADPANTNNYMDLIKQDDGVEQFLMKNLKSSFKDIDFPLTATGQQKSGTPAACPACSPGPATYYSRQSTPDSWTAPISNPALAPQTYDAGTLTPGTHTVSGPASQGATGTIFGSACATCGGSGESPSSQGGSWAQDQAKQALIQQLNDKIKDFTAAEAKLGIGGSEIITIAKDKVETIGVVINDFGSFRTDVKGKIGLSNVRVGAQGVYNEYEETPLVEHVQVDDLPGGNYTLSVGNKYNVQVGAGGVSIKTFGAIEMNGTITNITGEQVNLSSKTEVSIDGGKKLYLTADVLSLRQRNGGAVAIDGNLAVTNNVIIGGGAHIDGELTVNHITGPKQVYETGSTIVGANTVLGQVIGTVVVNGTTYEVIGNGIPSTIAVNSHSHLYENLPLTLGGSDDVYTAAALNNEATRNGAAAVAAGPVAMTPATPAM